MQKTQFKIRIRQLGK